MTRTRLVVGALVVAGVIGTVSGPAPVHAAAAPVVFVVNSVGDGADAVTDGVCQTSVAGECTLRAALTEAATVTAAPAVVDFAIPGSGVHRINVLSRLPLLDNGTTGITIDGLSQPGSVANTDSLVDNGVRTIELVGTGPTGTEGLIVLGSHNAIKGLVMHGFMRAIRMTGTRAQYNQVVGNVIGLRPDGSFDPAYAKVIGSPCIDINSGASQNRVGMPGNATRNVISGCFEKGITFYNQFTWKNYVQNNVIGLDPSGTIRRGNQSMGIDINWSTNGTIVGGTATQERNVISGNMNSGVEISHGTGTVNNQVIGNFIGTDPTGNAASSQTINHDVGVRLEGKPDCGTSACPLDEGLQTVRDNVIVNSGWGGILVDKGVHDSKIYNNRIGITLNGTIVNNTTFGIRLAAGATHNTIGPGNLIAGAQPGIQINPFGSDPVSTTSSPTQYNTITNNSITTTSGLGIDILPYGTVNQGGNGDPNVNQGIDVPALHIQGTQLLATTCAGCTVEAFAAPTAGASGPGVSYVASSVATADGIATFDRPATGWPAILTATSTTPQGSTSEFAISVRSAQATPPGTVAAPVATAGNGTASVAFTTVANDGGSPVTSYTVTANDVTVPASGGQQASAPAGPIVVGGLVNDHSYTFTATATNAVGTGPASAPSNAVTPTAGGGISVVSVVPRALGQGASWRQVKVNGAGFTTGVTASISGTGVTVKSVVVTSSTVLTLTVSVAADAVPGNRDVVVTTTGGATGTCAQCFTVNPAPTVTSVTPNTITQGQTGVVTDIVGAGFTSGIRLTISGTGLTAGILTRLDATHLRVTLAAATTADLGTHTLTLTNTDAGLCSTTMSVVAP